MKIRIIICAIVTMFLFSCGETRSNSGEEARNEFESATGIDMSIGGSAFEFKSNFVRDSSISYYKLQCSDDIFKGIANKLNLTGELLPQEISSTYWSKAVAEPSPVDPTWWKLAPPETTIFYKEDYFIEASYSVMSFWYDKDSNVAYMTISLTF